MIVSILVLTLFGGLILYSTVRIQFVEGDKWRAVGDSLHVKLRTVPAVRGSIYSEDGSLLATSVPMYKLSLDFKVIKAFHADSFNRYTDQLAALLAKTLQNRTSEEYNTLLKEGYRDQNQYLTVARSANFLQTRELQSWPIFNAGRYKGGVIVEERTIRKKPYYGLMARTIGHINENHKGAGIEASFDDVLSGINGEMVVRKIPGGYRPLENDIKINPENGKDIFTTIDVDLQDVVSEHLSASVLANGAAYGTAVLLEVATGKIKAISNISNKDGELGERYNYAIGIGYEPGSTIKLVSALAALEEDHVSPEDSVDIHYGKYKFFANDSIEDTEHDHKSLTYQQIIEKSSNVGVSITAYKGFRNDPEDFVDYFDKLHLTQPLGTGILGENIPDIHRPGNPEWNGMSIPSMSIGYSMTMSPLHVAMFYNAIANNGVMMKPYLISGIGSLGQVEEIQKPEVLERTICGTSTLNALKSMLEGVVQNGTGRQLKDLDFPVAGKTGTSKIAAGKAGYRKNEYHSSFCGYFPADNPKYTLIVLISRPTKGRYYGAAVALPVFKEIARNIYAKGVLRPLPERDTIALPMVVSGFGKSVKSTCKEFDLPFDYDARNTQLVTLHPETDKLTGGVINIEDSKMPDVRGLGISHCLHLFENQGYKVSFRGVGKVVEQSPLPGTKLTEGRTVYLRLGTRS